MKLTGTSTVGVVCARWLLLVSLLLAGMVPAGMMRQAGADGMRLVLCTSDGVQEIWLSDDGTTSPVNPDQDGKAGHAPHCVQVNLLAQAVATPDARPAIMRGVPVTLVSKTDQVLCRQVAGDARRTRAPPHFV